MKSRLQIFMTREGLTAARLAEVLGVQPSAISHILSGRNYPRFDFIANLLKAYPTVSARWFMLGEGDIYDLPPSYKKITSSQEDNDAKKTSIKRIESSSPETERPLLDLSEDILMPLSSQDTKRDTVEIEKHPVKKNAEKIVVFYDDGTFRIYENAVIK